MLDRRLLAVAGLAAVPLLVAAAPASACPDGTLRADVRPGGEPERLVVGEQDGRPVVRVFGAEGRQLGSFFAFDPGFTGGVSVAAGDLDGDGADEIVVGAGPGGGPNVRVFEGASGRQVADFFAFDPSFTGGVRVGAADVTGDGLADVVVRPAGAGVRALAARAQAFSGTGAILGPVTSLAGVAPKRLARFC